VVNGESEVVDRLGEMLKTLRRRAGLTQDQLAGLSTVSVRAIRDLELGKVQQPRRETVRLLAAALGLGGPRRAAFELAAGGTSDAGMLKKVYDVEQALPPTVIGPLFGRQPELHAVTELLGAERERLVTVVGCIGVGKTRLAREAAQVLYARNHIPVLWVHLGGGANAVAGASQLPVAGWVAELVAGGGPLHELAQIIGSKPTLLVLDGAAVSPALYASLMQVLHACLRLSILITTREPSPGLAGRVLPLAPLSVSGSSTDGGGAWDTEQPALALMMSYLRHLRPDILPTESVAAAMARICQALDGLPQALESAASWLSLYAPHQLIEAAESLPLTLTEPMSAVDSEAAGVFRRSLGQSIHELPPLPTALLRVLASGTTGWTVDAMAVRAQCTSVEALRVVHTLLLSGLVRPHRGEPDGQSGVGTFTVLNLVRHLINTEDPAARPAVITGRGSSLCAI
jgi:transcriptional regulator with XRE-family HTH domain